MRKWTLLAAVTLAGCAHLGATPKSALVISEDGRNAEAGGERWTAPETVEFFQRGPILHVVSSSPGRAWDVAVPIGPDGKLAWPPDAPFAAKEGAIVVKFAGTSPEVARLVESGQLHPHDDHFHLTHLFENEDWKALYRMREDSSPLPPIRRQVAATVLALLIDERLPGTSPDATLSAVRRMASIVEKARRAMEANVGARAVEMIISHDFEIRDDGRTMEIEGQTFHAKAPLRFAYCANHFHVEEESGKWAQPVEFDGGQNGAFAWPSSIFFEVAADGTVGERPSTSRWRKLSDGGQIRFTRDHWHVTEAYAHPRFQVILKEIADPKAPEEAKEKARALALDVMRLRLDVGSEAEFEARLDAIDQAIDRAAEEIEKAARKGAPVRK